MAAAGPPASDALVSAETPTTLVDANSVGRPVGDTSSSAVYVTDLPKNFIGGDEALHFALGELFGQYGKIKKIELYMQEGILETQDFKGEALVIYHKTKKTGSHEKGDPVYDACTDMDGRWRLLGKRGWRMRCEPAQWQKEGYDVKSKAKLHPCVEIGNLWDYDGSLPLSWFANMQEEIRKHCAEHIPAPFVKVEPSAGCANVWCKGAQDAMKLASVMHKSFFMGRKVVAALCRKEKPVAADFVKVPTGDLTMESELDQAEGPVAVGPLMPGQELAPAPEQQEDAAVVVEGPAGPPVAGPQGPTAGAAPLLTADIKPLRRGSRAKLVNLVSKPENNGRYVQVYDWVEDVGKYQVVMDDGKAVKVKPENLAALTDEELLALGGGGKSKKKKSKEAEAAASGMDVDDEPEDEAAAAQEMATSMASGGVRAIPEAVHDAIRDGPQPTICVDPSLLPKREEQKTQEETNEEKRARSRSRERRQKERLEAIKARVASDTSSAPGWVVTGPSAGAGSSQAGKEQAKVREPQESREELMKLSVGRLKELMKEFGKSARGCLEKKDFVDRLKPPPK